MFTTASIAIAIQSVIDLFCTRMHAHTPTHRHTRTHIHPLILHVYGDREKKGIYNIHS